MRQGSLKVVSQVSFGLEHALTPGPDPVGKGNGAGVMCPVQWDAESPHPEQRCTCSWSSPAGLWPPQAAQHRFVPGCVQFGPFSTVTTNCYQIIGN